MGYVLTKTSGEKVEITDQMLQEAQTKVDNLRPEYDTLEAQHEGLRLMTRHLCRTKCQDPLVWDQVRQIWYDQAAKCRALAFKVRAAIHEVSPDIWGCNLPGYVYDAWGLNYLARNAADRCRDRRNRYNKAQEA